MLFVPEGCAHGCVSLEDDTEIYYLTSAFYSPECVRGVRFDDPTFAVAWPIEVKYVSDQDRALALGGAIGRLTYRCELGGASGVRTPTLPSHARFGR